MTDGLPLLHSKDIEGELSELLSSSREHYLFAFFGQGDVTSVQVSGSGMFPVYSVRGPLELRQRLLELEGNDARAVFLVPWREGLPLDVAGRFARQSVRVVGKEARLKRLLGGVRQVDAKLLRGHPLVDHLLGHAQPASLQLGELEVSERKLWEVWLARAWGLDTEGGLAADVLLASAAQNGRGAEFAEVVRQAPKLGTALLQFLEDTLGPVGPELLRAWMAGKGEAALEVALICEALAGEPSLGVWVRSLVRTTLGVEGDELPARVAMQLGEAVATALPVYGTASGRERKLLLRALFERAEARVDDPEVRRALVRSSRLPSGFRLRLDLLGDALKAALEERTPSAMKRVLAAKKHVELHAGFVDDAHAVELRRAEMAVRLAGWLFSDQSELEPQAHEPPDADVAKLGRWYVEQGGYVDWARKLARGASGTAFDKGVQAVVAAADAYREALDLRFARALPYWVQANRPSHQVLPIDQVSKRVMAPYLEGHAERKLLVILLDGMAWAQASELLLSLEEDLSFGPAAWHSRGRSLKLGEARTPVVLAGLPTVTEVSRSAFFGGKPMVSGKDHHSSQDRERFRDNAALKKFFEVGDYPRLFLGGEGHQKNGLISEELRSAIVRDERRVVGVVVNAIDSSLSGNAQEWHPWRAENIRSLPELLAAAKEAGRSVLLASDHGHVPADRFEGGLQQSNGGARYRYLKSKEAPVEAYEVKLWGEGVHLRKGEEAVALIADDRHRYGAAPSAGEHGGATLAEVIAPCVIVHWDDAQSVQHDPERVAQACAKPDFWHFEVQEPLPSTPPHVAKPEEKERPKARRPKVSEDQLVLLPEVVAAPPPPAPAAPEKSQGQAVSRAATALQELPGFAALSATDKRHFVAALDYLLERSGVAQLSALASHVALPEHFLRGFISRKMQFVLNIDGFQVVTYNQTEVRLDREVLKQQFGVEL